MNHQPSRKVRRERAREIQRMLKSGYLLNPAYEESVFEEAFTLEQASDAPKYGFRESGFVKTDKGPQQAFSHGLFPKRFKTPDGIEEIQPFMRK